MSETKYRNHPNAPHNQPFVGAGRKNLTKKHSWWSATSSNYWRNAKKKKAKEE